MSIKFQPKMLTDCKNCPGGITMASLWTIRGYTQHLPSGKYTNSCYYILFQLIIISLIFVYNIIVCACDILLFVIIICLAFCLLRHSTLIYGNKDQNYVNILVFTCLCDELWRSIWTQHNINRYKLIRKQWSQVKYTCIWLIDDIQR